MLSSVISFAILKLVNSINIFLLPRCKFKEKQQDDLGFGLNLEILTYTVQY